MNFAKLLEMENMHLIIGYFMCNNVRPECTGI